MDTKSYLEFKKLNLVYKQTVGFEFFPVKIKINDRILNMQFWDCCGQELYESLTTNFFRNSNIFLAFYNAFDRESFDKAKSNIRKFQNINNANTIIVLCRSKYEISLNSKENQDIITDEEAMEYADKNEIIFFHIASFEKYETGINQLIKLILDKYIRKNNQ